MKRIRISSSERLNSYGFRVMASGIDFSDYRNNPIGFYCHNRNHPPICKWKDIQQSETDVSAEPEFDMEDEFGASVARKLENGFLNAASVGLVPLEWSDDPADKLPGQAMPTLKRSKCIEISIADIPSDKSAVVLFEENEQGNLVQLTEVKLNAIFNTETKKSMDKELLKVLNLSEGAQPAEAVAAITGMKEMASGFVKLTEALGLDPTKAKTEEGVGKITELTTALADSTEKIKTLSEAAHVSAKVSEVLEAARKAGEDAARNGQPIEVNLKELERKDPQAVRKLIIDNPAEYAKLFEKAYGHKITEEEVRRLKV